MIVESMNSGNPSRASLGVVLGTWVGRGFDGASTLTTSGPPQAEHIRVSSVKVSRAVNKSSGLSAKLLRVVIRGLKDDALAIEVTLLANCFRS